MLKLCCFLSLAILFILTSFVYADEIAPQISNVTVTSVTDETAVIEWLTDEPGDSIIQYDTASRGWGGYAFNEYDIKMDTKHKVTVTGLSSDTLYYFKVSSTDLAGNDYATSVSDMNPSFEYTFITLSPNDFDNDGDGFTENQGDCNDDNAHINPGAEEICGDGIDQDCSSTDLDCSGSGGGGSGGGGCFVHTLVF
jgi:hypothetical protein